jgi:hypothetical protein
MIRFHWLPIRVTHLSMMIALSVYTGYPGGHLLHLGNERGIDITVSGLKFL